MTIEKLCYLLKKQNLTNQEVDIAAIALLETIGYQVNPNTHLVIKKHCLNYEVA
jgi:hypothetical protein